MPYTQYSLNDFVLDDYFIKWVKSPDPQTDAYWQNWLKDNPQKEHLVEEARQMVLFFCMPGKQLSEEDKTILWEKIQSRNVHNDSIKQAEIIPIRRFMVGWLYNGKVAASLAAILLLTACWIWTSRRPHITRCRTEYGEVKNIKMPDGSAITLNANSSLSFPTVWDEQEDREVHLTGEAFFEVAKKTGKSNAKFVVHTKGMDIAVLGTRFNVNNRRDKVQVVLQEGKVSLFQAGRKNSQILMDPGDLVEYSEQDNKLVRKKVNPFMYSSWKEKETLFEDESLLEIAHQLEDTRGLQVIFADDSFRQLRFTGTLPNEDLDKFLLILSKSFGISVSRKGNQIILQKTPSFIENNLSTY